MSRLRAARREPGIEITPLIDVVFLLLIFLWCLRTFVQNRVINVSLPESDSAMAGTGETLQISVSASGDYWVAGQRAGSDIESLTSAMEGYAQMLTADERAKQSVEVRADAAAHQSVITSPRRLCRGRICSGELATVMSSVPLTSHTRNSVPNQ